MTSDPKAFLSTPPARSSPAVKESADATAANDAARRAVVDLAETHMLRLLPRRLNVSAFAAEHGLSLSHLEQLFAEVRGMSSYRAFLVRRLERVEQLAAETRLPLKLASRRCGFGHFGVFRRAFVSTFGREPTDGGPPPEIVRRRRVASGTDAA